MIINIILIGTYNILYLLLIVVTKNFNIHPNNNVKKYISRCNLKKMQTFLLDFRLVIKGHFFRNIDINSTYLW